MTRAYTTRWLQTPGGAELIIEEDGACPAFVAEISYDSYVDLYLVGIDPALNPNEEADPLDEAVGEADSLDEAKAMVEKWLVDTWGLETAHRMYYEKQSADWAEDNQDSLRVGANWWKRDSDGNLVFRLAIPSGNAISVINAGMVYFLNETWVAVSAPPYRVPQIEMFDSRVDAKAFVEKDVLEGA